ncbi:MAG TPA: serine hydroxymethyltransferase [Oligoflexia bacterium]|nr:serine hydroxymethyltransferase [Oligoflexia bacterium]HMP49537.1 serine hydroxymethyltransferase [Oligoflexia bacterium]
MSSTFFSDSLSSSDPQVYAAIAQELDRQKYQIELIASENIVSRAVLEAQGSVLTNKYAEGYPGRRYYQGCEFVDVTEQLAIDRLCQLFGCEYANVQPHSGATANQGVYMALCKPGDTILGMDLAHGGHLTHGASVNQSGKWFKAVSYGINEEGLIDYDVVEKLAIEHKPQMIIAGASAYARVIDFSRFRQIADKVGAYLFADVAHYAGLIVGGVYPNPFPDAHVVTTTTHKTLRGPRGGVIMTNDEVISKKINSAIFPGIQGGPLEHVIAAKAVAFAEALRPEFKEYASNVLRNARVLAETLKEGGLDIVSGGTDCHMMLVDLRPKKLTGKAADIALEHAGITCNKNAVPNDPEKPMVTSGIRLGTPAGTTRGFGVGEWKEIGGLILEVLDGLSRNGPEGNSGVEKSVKLKVRNLCERFPIYN